MKNKKHSLNYDMVFCQEERRTYKISGCFVLLIENKNLTENGNDNEKQYGLKRKNAVNGKGKND